MEQKAPQTIFGIILLEFFFQYWKFESPPLPDSELWTLATALPSLKPNLTLNSCSSVVGGGGGYKIEKIEKYFEEDNARFF